MDLLQDIAASLLENKLCSELWELKTFNEDESGLSPLMSEVSKMVKVFVISSGFYFCVELLPTYLPW